MKLKLTIIKQEKQFYQYLKKVLWFCIYILKIFKIWKNQLLFILLPNTISMLWKCKVALKIKFSLLLITIWLCE